RARVALVPSSPGAAAPRIRISPRAVPSTVHDPLGSMGALERYQLARLLAPCPRLTIARGTTREASAFRGTVLLIVERGLAALVATPTDRRRMIVSFCRANAVLPPPGAAEEPLGLEP